MSRLADFYIIGAMKCGTSTLHDQLARRRKFFMTTPKEPNFFSDDAAYAAGLGAYEALFKEPLPDQIVGESSTHYTKLPTFTNVVERIAKHTPHARFVYVMRDPIPRVVSQYVHEWSMLEVQGTIDEAVTHNERFAAYSCYFRQLKPYLDAFGADRILPVFFEKMIAEPTHELRRVAEFLGDDSGEDFVWNEEVAQQNAGAERMRKSALREGLTRSALGQGLKAALPQSLKDSLKSFWKLKKTPKLAPETELLLRKIINADLDQLSRLFDLPLDCDSFRTVARKATPRFVSLP